MEPLLETETPAISDGEAKSPEKGRFSRMSSIKDETANAKPVLSRTPSREIELANESVETVEMEDKQHSKRATTPSKGPHRIRKRLVLQGDDILAIFKNVTNCEVTLVYVPPDDARASVIVTSSLKGGGDLGRSGSPSNCSVSAAPAAPPQNGTLRKRGSFRKLKPNRSRCGIVFGGAFALSFAFSTLFRRCICIFCTPPFRTLQHECASCFTAQDGLPKFVCEESKLCWNFLCMYGW